MFCSSPHTTHVTAVVREVLPRTGLAWLDGDDDREWTVTRSTRGAGLDRLTPGARVELQVERHDAWLLVAAYTELPS